MKTFLAATLMASAGACTNGVSGDRSTNLQQPGAAGNASDDSHANANAVAPDLNAKLDSRLFLLVTTAVALPTIAAILQWQLADPQARVGLHLGLKMLSMAVSLAISLLTWNTRRGQPTNFVLAGFGHFAIAILGGLEMLIVAITPGATFADEGPLPVVLQLSADGAAVAAMMAAALGPSSLARTRSIRVGSALAAAWVAISLCVELTASRWLPSIARTGALIEMSLAFVALFAAWLFARRYRRGEAAFALLSTAALLAGIGIAFGADLPLGDLSKGLFSRMFKVIAWLLVYRTLFKEGILAPWHKLVETGRAVEEDRKRYRQLFETAPDGLLLVDSNGAIVDANPAAAAMFGWPENSLTGLQIEALVPQQLRTSHAHERSNYFSDPHTRSIGEARLFSGARRNGESFPVEVALVPQSFSGGNTTLCIVRDVTERHGLEQSLLCLALQDPLTELPNRRHFHDSVEKAMAHAERHGSTLALLCIDLDHFKHVNDSLGHSYGDELLRQVASRLKNALRGGDLLARMGGDEFALLLLDAGIDDAAAVAEKVLGALSLPFVHAGRTMKVGASVGITISPADARDVEEMMSNADLAMYRAKGQGRNTWCFFEQRMTERARERALLQQDLVNAIKRDQFALEFQPRVKACDGQLIGFEALLRWHHPDHGKVSPEKFIPLAEESGQIVAIGEWVLRESCKQAMQWQLQSEKDLTMSVNVSTHQLRHHSFVAYVKRVLAETGWPPTQLELEITETALMEDPREAADRLHQLVALGARIAIDDFGTGYSSLAYLKDYPLHRLKVDRRFVQELDANRSDRVIASSIIQLAHALGLQVTAEGVETLQQSEILKEHQCDEFQGYLFSAPISSTACEAWLPKLAHCDAPG
ncbi:MAG: EAL domain-containing protein [Burkholderiaceae bacterium]|nr:EAL domain-containing protein [Burkholderiaceae bacterium]